MNTYYITVYKGLFKKEFFSISLQEVNETAALESVKQMINDRKARYKVELV